VSAAEHGTASGAASPPWLVLSPHLDDAALSLGGAIHQLVRAGEEVVVLTVFTGDEPLPPASPFAAAMLRGWRFPAGQAMAGRRDEDRAACASLGSGLVHLPLLEAIHRRDPATGAALYPDVGSLFGEVAPSDDAVQALAAVLATELSRRPPGTRLLAPLGVGGHVDHHIVRAAADGLRGVAVRYYEEYPYCRAGGVAVEPALGDLALWRHDVVALTLGDLDAKAEAIAAYRSQVPHLFRSGSELRREVREQARRVGGERLWRRICR
jgi:LmbE family N-acetylglucosaminyl deacetylase